MPENFDYILIAFFAAFLGLQYVKTKATGHLWFLLPMLLIVGLNQGWGTLFGNDNNIGRAYFILYRMATVGSCFLAAYLYYRDYHKRKQEAIAATAKKRKKQKEIQQAKQNQRKK